MREIGKSIAAKVATMGLALGSGITIASDAMADACKKLVAGAGPKGIARELTMRRRSDDWVKPGTITPRSRSKRYPEQSHRQAMRKLRRAQGGPGLTEGPMPLPRTHKRLGDLGQ